MTTLFKIQFILELCLCVSGRMDGCVYRLVGTHTNDNVYRYPNSTTLLINCLFVKRLCQVKEKDQARRPGFRLEWVEVEVSEKEVCFRATPVFTYTLS